MKRLAVLFTICLSLASVSMAVSHGQTANRDNLVHALRSKDVDRIVSVLNDVKRSRYQGDVLPLLEAVWNKDNNALAGIPADVIDLDIVRIHVADVLVQAHKNDITEAPITAIHSYARDLLGSRDKEVVSAAIFVLGQIDNPSDAAILGRIALQEGDYLFRSAVIALSIMCSSAALTELNRIQSSVSSDRSQFVEDARARLENFTYWSQRRAQGKM